MSLLLLRTLGGAGTLMGGTGPSLAGSLTLGKYFAVWELWLSPMDWEQEGQGAWMLTFWGGGLLSGKWTLGG